MVVMMVVEVPMAMTVVVHVGDDGSGCTDGSGDVNSSGVDNGTCKGLKESFCFFNHTVTVENDVQFVLVTLFQSNKQTAFPSINDARNGITWHLVGLSLTKM